MDNTNNQSLDDTLKGILGEVEEDASKQAAEPDNKSTDAKSTDEKPKRTRRTAAQIEADKKAEEEAKKKAEETENTDELKPEIVADTEDDAKPDIEDSAELEADPIEPAVPEVIPDNDLDSMPDIQDKPEPEKEIKHPTGEAREAFKEEDEKEVDSDSLIGKQFILDKAVPMFRAKNINMRVKSYRGLVTVIEDPSGGFVKVQFLRQGFGLCESYMLLIHLIPEEDDEDEMV